jgi:DNA-binding transcriptional LysR family regulator
MGEQSQRGSAVTKAKKEILAWASEPWMKIEPVVSLRVNGVALTPHQLQVLLEVSKQGSQRRAAEALGLATPVVHRALGQIEAKAKVRLLDTSPSGTSLNEDGRRLAREFAALLARMRAGGSVVVGGTVLTEDLLLSALSRLDGEASYDLIISDDDRNMRDYRAGLMDLVLLDDPLVAYDTEGSLFDEVATDRLLYVDKGEAHVRFRFGAQRIGFRHLDSIGRTYRIEGSTRSLPQLLRSNRSFFINESLALRKGIKVASTIEPRLLEHKIIAIYQEEKAEITWLLRELHRERLGA